MMKNFRIIAVMALALPVLSVPAQVVGDGVHG